jgi:hypothetical protein
MRPVRTSVLDGERSLAASFRRKRFDQFLATFPELGGYRVVDLGGTASFWERSPARPAHVVVVNLEDQPAALPDWITAHHGDACELPTEVAGDSFDLVFSNSVIEHVGGHDRRLRFAESVVGLAPRHWVQTPNHWFPVEPHFLAPGIQHLPVGARARVLRHWPLVHTPPVDQRCALGIALETQLLSRTELAYYFPSSEIRRERLAGLTKSLVAVRTA